MRQLPQSRPREQSNLLIGENKTILILSIYDLMFVRKHHGSFSFNVWQSSSRQAPGMFQKSFSKCEVEFLIVGHI
jgi:hypothetical protein